MKIGGVEHYVIRVEVSSVSHPFYTGTRKLVDTAGRVDKFLEKVKRAQKIKEKEVKIVEEELDEMFHEDVKEMAKPKKEEAEKAPKKAAAAEKAPAAKKAKAEAPAKKTAAKKAAPKAKGAVSTKKK